MKSPSIALGICILAKDPVCKIALDVSLALNSLRSGPTITPHITLLQGLFFTDEVPKLKNAMEKCIQNFPCVTLEMESFLSEGTANNVFWDVKPGSSGWDTLNKMNAFLCDAPDGVEHPVKLLPCMQTFAHLDIVKQYGRTFNIPGHNRPHITVGYGIADPLKRADLANHLHEPFCFSSHALSLVEIDEIGNVVSVFWSTT